MGFDGIDLTVRPKGHVAPERVAEDLPRALDAIRAKGTHGLDDHHRADLGEPPDGERDLRGGGQGGHQAREGRLLEIRAEGRARGSGRDGTRSRRPRRSSRRSTASPSASTTIRATSARRSGTSRRTSTSSMRRRSATTSIRATRSMEGGGVGWKAATLLALPRMKMISVKDAFWEKGPKGWVAQHCPMGEGMVDWPWFATTIAHSPFAGPISVHVEYKIPGSTPEELRRNMMSAAKRDLEFTKRQFAAVAASGARARARAPNDAPAAHFFDRWARRPHWAPLPGAIGGSALGVAWRHRLPSGAGGAARRGRQGDGRQDRRGDVRATRSIAIARR